MIVAATVICCVLAVITVLFAVVPIVIGRVKLKRALRPIEYYPPRGFSPIDVLIKYYGFRANTHALLNPMMLYWADRGFITIEEDCKRGLKLTKLRDIEQDNDKKSAFAYPKRNDVATDYLNDLDYAAEKKLFDGIFAEGDVFYTLAAKSSYNDGNKEFISSCKDNARAMRTTLSKKLSHLSFVFAVFAAIIAVITCAAACGGGPIFITSLFPIIALIALHFLPFLPHEAPIAFIMYPFFAVWGGAPLGALLAIAPSFVAAPIAVTILTSAVTIMFLSDRIDIRSDADLTIYGHIAAFKTFLSEAEADRINTLVEENPNYYYDVLPYCYILKITDKLKSKFDRIALDGPSWYLGDLRNTLMF